MGEIITNKSRKERIQNLLLWWIQVFILLFILTFPFDTAYLPVPAKWLEPVFSNLAEFTSGFIFQAGDIKSFVLLSDTKALYIHVLNLAVISIVFAIIFQRFYKMKNSSTVFIYWFTVIISYYLACHLLTYGFNKVFKWQFFLPEPNTLYEKVGNTPKDLLYWTSMGSSYSYNVFTGFLEVITGIFLLLRKTRLIGAFLAFGIMMNVVVINFSFDISVKIFSLFLLLLSVMIIFPAAKTLYSFFIKHEKAELPLPLINYKTVLQKRIYFTVKYFVIILLIYNSIVIYFITGNFNDDLAERPLFHGAYEVKDHANGWKRAFIHRRGYFIIQTEDENMHDFKLEYDLKNHQLVLENDYTGKKYFYPYSTPDKNTLVLSKISETDTLEIVLKKNNVKKMPLLQNEFHWTID